MRLQRSVKFLMAIFREHSTHHKYAFSERNDGRVVVVSAFRARMPVPHALISA
jgi:hypothetical protein